MDASLSAVDGRGGMGMDGTFSPKTFWGNESPATPAAEYKQEKDLYMMQVYSFQNSLKMADGMNRYCFRSVVDQTLDSEQLVREIVGYNSTLTDADVRAVMSVLNDRVKHFVNLGYKVELPFGYVFNRANGTVRRLNDGFVPGTANHRISTVFKFKDDAKEEMVKDAAYKLAGNGFVMLPSITELYSKLEDGRESEELSFKPGAMLCIKGKRISFDAADTDQGVFLIDEKKNEVRIGRYNRIGTNIVEAYVPDPLPAGLYKVKLVCKPGTDRYESCVASKHIELKENVPLG